jgi:hypothetical protein
MTPARILEHSIAETLGMTVGEMKSRVSAREFMDWADFLAWKNGKQTPNEILGEVKKWQGLTASARSSSTFQDQPKV